MNSLCIGSMIRQSTVSRFILAPTTLFIQSGILVTPTNEIPVDNWQDIVAADYLADLDAVCIATKVGEVTMYHLDGRIEPVGMFDDGILAFRWSPDQELCIVITGNANVIQLNSEFEPIIEFPLTISGGVDFVSVGWGKKETQFHGRAGKQAAQQSGEKGSLTSHDDFLPRITWRGDGAFFALSAVQSEKRTIKIFNREGLIQHSSEDVAGLEQHVEWRPSGNLIASVQQSNKHQVIFFEKNGLRHGEFDLRDHDKVSSLQWNADSSLLAIVKETGQEQFLQLWGMCNYHWYMKLCIPARKIHQIEWDTEDPLILHVLEVSGVYSKYEFNIVIYQCESVVAVVDGKKLQLTPFSKAQTPPPMSHSELTFENYIMQVSFLDGSRAAVLLVDGTVELIGNIDGTSKDLARLGRIQVPKDIRKFEWISDQELIGIRFQHSTDEIIHVIFDNNGDVRTTEVRAPVGQLFVFSLISKGKLAFQTTEGEVFELIRQDSALVPVKRCSFPSLCIDFAVCTFQFTSAEEVVWIGLNKRNKWYLNGSQIAQDATSFFVHPEFLLMTTLDQRLKFVPLRQDVGGLHDVQAEEGVERIRRVEQGSRIVTVAGVKVVLQMPRGNLETIAPRPLVLSHVRSLLSQGQYRKAFLDCRRHRLDLNFLIDHDLEAFERDVKVIVNQIPETDYLNLIISSLKDQDARNEFKTSNNVVLTRSGEQRVEESRLAPGIKRYILHSKKQDKVNRICELLRGALTPAQNFVQPVLTTFAKQNPPLLTDALQLILELKKTDTTQAEDALKYLIFLVDVETLYNASLGMYDFALTLMVAQQSQKDPREYLPFLKELSSLSESERRYRVDDSLGIHEKALLHLRDHIQQTKGDMKVISGYIQKHKLYNVALALYPLPSKEYVHIANLCGEYLVDQREYKQAGCIFEQVDNLERALDAYTLGLEWRSAMQLSILMDQQKDVASVLKDGLIESKRFVDAAEVMEMTADYKAAIELYCQGRDYDAALFICRRYKLPADSIFSSLQHYSSVLTQDLRNRYRQFEKDFVALEKLRFEKLTGTFVVRQAVEDVEMLEDTASMATTRVTGRTFITSRTG
jgi:elongator complex protein 1